MQQDRHVSFWSVPQEEHQGQLLDHSANSISQSLGNDFHGSLDADHLASSNVLQISSQHSSSQQVPAGADPSQAQLGAHFLTALDGNVDHRHMVPLAAAPEAYVAIPQTDPRTMHRSVDSATAAAPAAASTTMTDAGDFSFGTRGLEPASTSPRLTHSSLDMDNLVESRDFFLPEFDFADLSPLPQGLQGPSTRELNVFPTPAFDDADSTPGRIASDASQERQTHVDEEDVTAANVFSQIGSPLPSMRALPSMEPSGICKPNTQKPIATPCWKVSQSDYQALQAAVSEHSAVLPRKFVLPSRHTMSHFLERCINSLYKHQPFVHVPTFRVAESSLDLILAMCAVGAQLRFECELGMVYFHASKALIMSSRRIREASSVKSSPALDASMPPRRRLRSQTMQSILTLMSFGSWGPSTLLGEAVILQNLLAMIAREEGLGEAVERSLDRELSLHERWREWVNLESMRRIKIVSYTFTNLQSLAYNMVPPILTAEVRCCTPASAQEWASVTAERWVEAQSMSGIVAVPFQTAFQDLFRCENGGASETPTTSALGNYALIFGILQCIFFLRQRHPVPFPAEHGTQSGTSLSSEDVSTIARALCKWQSWWEKCPESAIEPGASTGPISFNSIACLRLAWIRLYADLGPCRDLATRDLGTIVQVFTSGPPLQRHRHLNRVLLQAIHALSVPVRLGVRFVARSQTLFWSVNQALCTLECAVIIRKWLEVLEVEIAQAPMSKEERNIILMLRGVVLESGFFTEEELTALSISTASDAIVGHANNHDNSCQSDDHAGANHYVSPDASSWPQEPLVHSKDNSDRRAFVLDMDLWTVPEPAMPTPPSFADDTTAWQRQIAGLSVAVARLWAEIFSDNHVFDLVTTIGRTLGLYSQRLGRTFRSHRP